MHEVASFALVMSRRARLAPLPLLLAGAELVAVLPVLPHLGLRHLDHTTLLQRVTFLRLRLGLRLGRGLGLGLGREATRAQLDARIRDRVCALASFALGNRDSR